MKYRDLRDFVHVLEGMGELRRVQEPVSPRLEVTALSDRVLRAEGPALLFEQPTGYKTPALTNLFGTTRRVALGMGAQSLQELRDVGHLLASLKEPEPPKGLKDAGRLIQMAKSLWDMKPSVVRRAACQEEVFEGSDVDLKRLPIQTCWPGDIGPLITWGLVITRGPQGIANPRARQNLGIYRQQLIGRRQLIMRWLAHRGGALDFRDFALANPGQPFPIAVALGADPATILGAVTPVPDSLSEYQFAGLLRGSRTELVDSGVGEAGRMLQVPASAEIVLEGHIPVAAPGYTGLSDDGVALKEKGGYLHALEGPFGDHTGYYNEQDWFPVFEVKPADTAAQPDLPLDLHRQAAGRTGHPGRGAERGFRADPAKAVSARSSTSICRPRAAATGMAVISIKKAYPGHAKRLMFGLWSYLRQFMYTKFIVVVDEDIDVRDWKEVVWAITTRMDPVRDTTLVDSTPIDYLDFASPISGLGGKMGLDATNKWPGETTREWGRTITMPAEVQQRADKLFEQLFANQQGFLGLEAGHVLT